MEQYEKSADGKGLKIITVIPERTQEIIVMPDMMQNRRKNLVDQITKLQEEVSKIDIRLGKVDELKVLYTQRDAIKAISDEFDTKLESSVVSVIEPQV